MTFAAFSTVLAVFENIISCMMELTGWSRKKSSLVNLFGIILLSLPCVLGYNVWSWDGFSIFGGAVLDLEDFLVSNIYLPWDLWYICCFVPAVTDGAGKTSKQKPIQEKVSRCRSGCVCICLTSCR